MAFFDRLSQEVPWHAAFNDLGSALLNKHAVSVGVEAVALSDGVVVGVQYTFGSSERTHQHKESGLGEVEVRQQCAHDTENVTGMDENVCFSVAWLHSAVRR